MATRELERADRDDDQVWLRRFRVEELRAAVSAEREDMLLSVRLVQDSREVAEATDDLHVVRFKRRLHPEGASDSTLARKAVTQMERANARHFQTKLPTVTGGISGGHRRGT
jgi:hypothetical protein